MVRKAAVPAGPAEPPAKVRESLGHRLSRLGRELLDAATLRAHTFAVRLDRVPQEFGDADPVDEKDPKALRSEWLRQYRIWAGASPEQLFAIKAGGLMLGAALVLLLIMVAAF